MRLLAVLSIAVLAATGCRNEYEFGDTTAPAPLENDHGQWLSMGLAPDDNLVVSYYDRTRGALGFAVGTPTDSGVRWAHERVDGYPDRQGMDPGDRGLFSSLAVSPDGTVWVAYHDAKAGTLMVAKRVGGEWTTEVVDADAEPTGLWTSIAVTDDGRPIVAYHDAANGDLKMARHDGSAWSTAVAWEGTPYTGTDADGAPVVRPAAAGRMARLFLVGNTEYVVFYDAAHQDLHLLEGFAGAYAHTVVHAEEGRDVGQWPSLWTDGDEVVIAYHDVTNQDLLVARRTGGSAFQIGVVDDGEFVGADTEVYKHDGTTSIVYFDGHNNDMKRATDTGTGWIVETLGGERTAVGYHNEVVMRRGQPWVASYDYTNRGIFTRSLGE